jgi:hypothetical protein
MTRDTLDMLTRLHDAGISNDDALSLRRIAMTLHRWYELECGDGNEYASWCITRGYKKNGVFEHDEKGEPFEERHVHSENKARYSRIPDRERGAHKRLTKIMARYPSLSVYLQTDPRGAPLYILRPGETAENYNRGIAVHR